MYANGNILHESHDALRDFYDFLAQTNEHTQIYSINVYKQVPLSPFYPSAQLTDQILSETSTMRFPRKIANYLYIGFLVPRFRDDAHENWYVTSVESNINVLLDACNLEVKRFGRFTPSAAVYNTLSDEEQLRQRDAVARITDKCLERKEREHRALEELNSSAKSARVRK